METSNQIDTVLPTEPVPEEERRIQPSIPFIPGKKVPKDSKVLLYHPGEEYKVEDYTLIGNLIYSDLCSFSRKYECLCCLHLISQCKCEYSK